ncbi:MAG: hypothetical protein EAZ55_03475 [Cytophagales bacterium]|nr:MAG: hypothetical protein EAZ55_03475 [Cytophagales bacterium]
MLIFFSVVLWNCQKKEEVNITNTSEFIAQDVDFENFRNWVKIIESPNALSNDGRAHTDAARVIWIKQNTKPNPNEQYPIGTILVKEVQGGYGIVAMVKRGGTYNAEHQYWEWFKLDNNGKIISRNASSLCNNCHALAKSSDYVFSQK